MNELNCRYHKIVTGGRALLVPILIATLLVPAYAESPGRKGERRGGGGGGGGYRQQGGGGGGAPARSAPRQNYSRPSAPARQQRSYQAPRPQVQRSRPTRSYSPQAQARPQRSQRQNTQRQGNWQRQAQSQMQNRPARVRQNNTQQTQQNQQTRQYRHQQTRNYERQANNRPSKNYRQSQRENQQTRAYRHTTANYDVNRNVNRNVDRNVNRYVNRNGNWNKHYRPGYNSNTVVTNVTRQPRVTRNVVVNRPYAYSQPYVNQPYVYSQPYCPPVVYNNYYSNPYAYSDYSVRRYYRPRRSNCLISLLTLGFYMLRPYNTYNYAQTGYDRPYYYGDDTAYQPPLEATTEGGPVADANSANDLSNQMASVVPGAPATQGIGQGQAQGAEQALITSVSNYVDAHSVDQRFQITDAAFKGETWNLDLAQAPAVFEIADGMYSVVTGFEGTLGASQVPSTVVVEFFVARQGSEYQVRNAWITNTNGIPRAKLYQSPVYKDVQTWQPGQTCPFTGQPMVEIPQVKQG